MSRSLSSLFDCAKQKPPCLGAYTRGCYECDVCGWKKECMEAGV